MYKCPDCGDTLVVELVEIKRGAIISKNTYKILYSKVLRCPNEDKHGIDQICKNCGKPVSYPDQHRHFLTGQIGSLRWTCIRGELH